MDKIHDTNVLVIKSRLEDIENTIKEIRGFNISDKLFKKLIIYLYKKDNNNELSKESLNLVVTLKNLLEILKITEELIMDEIIEE